MNNNTDQIDISVIAPLFNEQDNIELLYKSIKDVLVSLDISHEIVLVDDGSSDNTYLKAKQLAENDKHLRIVKFRKNYGQTAAMAAGIEFAQGKTLFTMDGDLQNDPTDIPKFIEKIDEGFDIVVGWRFNRQDKLITRKIPSRIANWLIGKVTSVPIKDNGCSLKAYKANIVKNIPLYSEMHRFIPAMLSLSGATISEIKVKHHARKFGESKYGLSRIYKVLLDLITIKTLVSFLERPLLWFGFGGLIMMLIAMFTLYSQFISQSGQPSIVLLSVTFIFSATALFLVACGILAELVYKTGSLKIESLSALTTSFK